MSDPLLVRCVYLILATPPAVTLIGFGLFLGSLAGLVRTYGPDFMGRILWALDAWLSVSLPGSKAAPFASAPASKTQAQ